MYNDEDLNMAVSKSIFTKESVELFRREIAQQKEMPAADEENFRLVSSLNDIFVVIASLLFLFSGAYYLNSIQMYIGFPFAALASWGIAEFFVRKRKMALPAIVLLVTFVGAIFAWALSFYETATPLSFVWAGLAGFAAAGLHWFRFKVPITIAVGSATVTSLLCGLIVYFIPAVQPMIVWLVFCAGVFTFLFAMYWDSLDTKRITRKSDVAFWLHLISAPMIIHPLFKSLAFSEGEESVMGVSIMVFVYIVMIVISLIVDRRAFMVSALAYVLFAFKDLFEAYEIKEFITLTGAIIGSSLLVLSAFWSPCRKFLLKLMPAKIKARVPASPQ